MTRTNTNRAVDTAQETHDAAIQTAYRVDTIAEAEQILIDAGEALDKALDRTKERNHDQTHSHQRK